MKLDITLFGALPFRRVSKTAKRQRRTHLKKSAPTTGVCSNCGAVVAPHRACTKCGFYKGKNVLSKEEKIEESTAKTAKEEKVEAPKKETKKATTKKTSSKKETKAKETK